MPTLIFHCFSINTDRNTDGEVVDAIEHYFWGQTNGTAIELGALDGSPISRSMTHEYELSFGWKRILIDANPLMKRKLLERSPNAFSVKAAICSITRIVHFAHHRYTGGIVEFMDPKFIEMFHPEIYNYTFPPGNISSIDFDTIRHLVKRVICIPLSLVLAKAHVNHVNYFILDVEVSYLLLIK